MVELKRQAGEGTVPGQRGVSAASQGPAGEAWAPGSPGEALQRPHPPPLPQPPHSTGTGCGNTREDDICLHPHI